MPKTKISEFSATPGNNTDIDGINIAEGCAPSGINDAIRELMAQLKDFQAGTAGDSFNGPVGTTTAAAGAFTTLSASSTVSGTGFSTYLASPPAIGGTTAAAGSFTTLSASSSVTLSGGTANGIAYLNGSKVLTTGSALSFDGTNFRAVSNARIEGTGVGITGSGDGAEIYSNSGITYFQGLNRTSLTYIPIVLSGGTYIAQTLGGSEQMRLTSTGLGIGTSSPASKLDVNGASILRGDVTTTGAFIPGANMSAPTADASVYRAADNTLAFATASTQRMVIDSSGNLGLGVTPSAWSLANGAAIDIGTVGTIVSQQSGSTVTTEFGRNFYYNGTNFIYKVSGGVARYSFGSSAHNWFIAPSGTAGNPISFTQAMTLTSGGNLLVKTTADNGVTCHFNGGANANIIRLTGASTTNSGYIGMDGDNFTISTGASILERARITSAGDFIQTANTTAPTLSTNGTVGIQRVSDTQLKILMRGSDGVTRSVTLTLA